MVENNFSLCNKWIHLRGREEQGGGEGGEGGEGGRREEEREVSRGGGRKKGRRGR